MWLQHTSESSEWGMNTQHRCTTRPEAGCINFCGLSIRLSKILVWKKGFLGFRRHPPRWNRFHGSVLQIFRITYLIGTLKISNMLPLPGKLQVSQKVSHLFPYYYGILTYTEVLWDRLVLYTGVQIPHDKMHCPPLAKSQAPRWENRRQNREYCTCFKPHPRRHIHPSNDNRRHRHMSFLITNVLEQSSQR